MLDECVERIYVKDMYGEIPLGVFIIRGENVVLLGELVSSHHFLFFSDLSGPHARRYVTIEKGVRCRD